MHLERLLRETGPHVPRKTRLVVEHRQHMHTASPKADVVLSKLAHCLLGIGDTFTMHSVLTLTALNHVNATRSIACSTGILNVHAIEGSRYPSMLVCLFSASW